LTEDLPVGSAATAPPGDEQAVLVLDQLEKSFGAVRALTDGRFQLRRGEVHALVGENGAGKSTLVKIVAGVHRPDRGRMLLEGTEVVFANASESQRAGIAVIFQEPLLFPDLSVAENIFIERQPVLRGRRIDWRGMQAQAGELFERLGVRIDPQRPARGLSIADQQLVEIAKAISRRARVIVMDEPTAALTSSDVQRLFRVIDTLREDGASVIFISHRLEEVFEFCQRVTVMRDGSYVLTSPVEEITTEGIIRAMVGRDTESLFARTERETGEVVLEVEHLTREGVFTDVSFRVRSGEIVALAGLVGAGRTEVARAIFGIDRWDAGSVRVRGRPLRGGSPTAAMAVGVALVPEDRRQQGLVLDLSIERNVALASLGRVTRIHLILPGSERRFASDWATRLRLKYSRLSATASTLSGGNQQKVVLAKWLARNPAVLIVDEPTRGIDVGTKAEVHRLLSELAASGVAVLMISSELPEVLGMADRVVVLCEGKVAGEFDRSEADEHVVMRAATGLAREALA
jgi:rhamnose transport system ATP-binding protein